MPVSTPNGYLDFTNATPRATKVIATSNVGVGISNPEFGLDVHGTANVGTLTATTATVSGNVYAPNLPLATIGSNLVTWNDSTGVFQDSGGLFSNKLAVVSEQPPSALAGASTTITNHGVYKVTASTGSPENAFDKSGATSWTASNDYGGGGGTGVYVPGTARLHTSTEQGDWIALEFPYKTTLRHLTFTGNTEKANLYATNDNITWTELKNWESGETTVVVDASENYKKYGLVTTKTTGSVTLSLTELRFFTESFAIDGGKVAMASGAITGGNTVVDQTGPHARASPPLRKYPEVALTSNVGVGGYVASTDSVYNDRDVYRAFNNLGKHGGEITTSGYFYSSADSSGNGFNQTTGLPISGIVFQDENGTSYTGHYVKLQFPTKIKLDKINILTYKNLYGGLNDDRRPYEGTFLGSNDGTNWYLLKTYNNGDVLWSENNYRDDQYSILTELSGITNTNFYSYIVFVIEKITPNNAYGVTNITELEYYGYEETSDPDTSVDTTITSQFNLPDTTGVKLYIDGDKGSTPTDYSGEGHTLTDNSESFSGNAWSFSSLSTSNVTMSTGDFAMEGTHPHSVSMWFNCANVTSNATLFHVGIEAGEGDAKTAISLTETGHLGWIDGGDNQFVTSNTWHNLVYATQGSGGVRTCYLDGRKLGDAQVQDTFGDYPPFDMTGYSHGGYTVSASSNHVYYPPYYAFDGKTTHTANDNSWISGGSKYDTTTGVARTDNAALTTVDGVGKRGEWIQMAFPHKMVMGYVALAPQTDSEDYRSPKEGVIAGSNDGETWETMHVFTNQTSWTDDVFNNYVIDTNVGKSFKYVRIIIEKVQSGVSSNTNRQYTSLAEIKFYGHKENDTTRFPVSSTVLKYPHIAMTDYAQRGYVASASGENLDLNPPRAAYTAFAEGGGSGMWDSGSATYQTTGNYDVKTDLDVTLFTLADGITQRRGHWIKLRFPRKILLSHYYQENTSFPLRRPDSVSLLGSDDDINWYIIKDTFSVPNQDENTISVNATTAYRYVLYMVHSISGSEGRAIVNKLRYYGTEEDLDIVARVGEGLDGKVANFRVYDKYLREEQALELWDAQKDQFGRATSSVSVYKGHVGIGTTEPEGALSVLDEPGDVVQLPPGNMTAHDQYFEGHGVFRTRTSPGHQTDSYPPWEGFNDTYGTLWYTGYGNSGPSYNGTGGAYSNTAQLGSTTVLGEYLVLEMPYKVYPERLEYTRQVNGSHLITNAFVYGRVGNGIWKEIGSFTDGGPSEDWVPKVVDLDSSEAYDQLAFIPTKRYAASATAGVSAHLVRYYGTRERGQSTLHDGELKLTKNLTVPRIGPPLDADNTPRRDRLVVEYNTSTNPTFYGVVRDTSGRGNDGVLYDNATYDVTKKALVFDGSGDYIDTGVITPSMAGATVHSMSVWFKSDTASGLQFVTCLGEKNGGGAEREYSAIRINGTTLQFWCYSNDLDKNSVITAGEWYHVVAVYLGGGTSESTMLMYLNGERITSWDGDTTDGNALNFVTPSFAVGEDIGRSGYRLDGQVSNPKLWDVALTADEVKRLYYMGRCDEGHHVVNFSKTRVGIGLGDGEAPTYTLDVRGEIRSQGSLVPSFTGQHKCVPENGEPMEKGLVVSAKKNKFIKLNGSLETGKKAITIDESLPVVSLSNVTQDKACFGVVSSTEEANTIYRIETTNGGVISQIPKTLGDNRVIVNSVGEGAIWVCDANGPLESGDYITTSNVAGYGQKQDGEFLANYTVAKITMDCDFTASNVAVQAIKKVETLKTVTQDVWEGLRDYDRSSNTETQYINESNVVLSVEEYESLAPEEQNTYSETTIQTYYRIQRGENVLDEHGMLQWEDTGATEPGYELRYLDASGQQTDEANCVHRAAFVGCTYHCG
jgi:hypothetical protein